MSQADSSRNYRLRHPERVSQTRAAYRARNLEKIRRYDREKQVRERAQRRAWLDAIKVERGCTDCGYKAHPRALDWDHVGTDKLGDVGRLAHSRIAMSLLLAEMAKCEVVCANCHRIRTFNREQDETRSAAREADGQIGLFE